jgi:hypothetical protein
MTDLEEKKNQEEEKEEKKPVISRIDLNLEDNKIFTLSKYPRKSKEISWKEILPTGEEIERKIIIGKMPDTEIEVGCLDTYHYLMYQILKCFLFEKLLKEEDFSKKIIEKARRKERISFKDLSKEEKEIVKKPIHFSINRILKLLKISVGGWQYKDIVKWIEGLRFRPIIFENTFYLASGEELKEWIGMTILSHLKFYEKKDRKRKKVRGYGYFKFDDNLLENDLNFYNHPVRFDVIATLKKPISEEEEKTLENKKDKKEKKKRERFYERAIFLYIYIDRMLSNQNYFNKNLKDLFREMGWSDKYVRRPYDRKAQLLPIIKLLRGKPLSTGILSYIEIVKTADGKDYKLICKKTPFEEPQKEIPERLELKEEQPPEKAQELVKYFHKNLNQPKHEPTQKEIDQATSLIKKYGYEKAKKIVDWVLRNAEITGFQMRLFGAVISKESDAVAEIEATESYMRYLEEKTRQHEEELKRIEKAQKEFEAKPLEEKVKIKLQQWLELQKALKREPTAEQIEKKRQEYIKEFSSS